MAPPIGNKNALGHKCSPEAREKMRIARLKNPNRYWLGRKRSPETIQKILKTKKGQPSGKIGKQYPHLWGEKNKLWKGGSKTSNGYLIVCIGRRRILLHRYVIECFLGRRLRRNEHIHHKDGNKTNNKLENLELLSSRKHKTLHLKDTLQKYGRYYNRWEGMWIN